MKNYPCVNANNIRLGSLIMYVCHKGYRLAIVCSHKCTEIYDFNYVKSDFHSFIIQCVDDDETINISFSNKKDFYNYLLVVSY